MDAGDDRDRFIGCRHGDSRSITRSWICGACSSQDLKNLTSIHRSSRWQSDRARAAGVWCHVKRPFFFRTTEEHRLPLRGLPPPSQLCGARTFKDRTRTRRISNTEDVLRMFGWKSSIRAVLHCLLYRWSRKCSWKIYRDNFKSLWTNVQRNEKTHLWREDGFFFT